MMKGKEDPSQIDIKSNKVKQGYLTKRSRVLKEWKQRWMVLTKNYLYSFAEKGVYRNATEKIPLKEVTTIKTYFKNQYERPQILRVESNDAQFYLSAENHQAKMSWITAIEKMTQQACFPENKSDSQNIVRQTIRMSSAIRLSSVNNLSFGNFSKQKKEADSDIFKKLRLVLNSKTVSQKVLFFDKIEKQSIQIVEKQEQTVKATQHTQKTASKAQIIVEDPNVSKLKEKYQSKNSKSEQQPKLEVQKRIQYKEKIVYVDKIVQKVVKVPVQIERIVERQRIVYLSEPSKKIDKQGAVDQLTDLFKELIENKVQNPRPIVDFIIFIALTGIPRYQQASLQFCTDSSCQRFFAELLLIMLNEEFQEQKLNSYLKFIGIIYENNFEYFYSSDVKIVIDIILREIQLNRSDLNQYLNLFVLRIFSEKEWWKSFKHRKEDLQSLIEQISNIGSPENRALALELLRAMF